ncbi:uncharacterized protein FIBRA_06327 [Fibroporia radiculosa]|uniref:ZIP zinc/iron transport family n=1 Tax=Fibroporia radiculosa TaxID=599839 RepID=J4GSJ5_9APHY|nr:uncharacterized protein FIBRA_06327 [Fibroporia radiculosa]CCM04165.1 predicted protein [Fibroporia radiculosa]
MSANDCGSGGGAQTYTGLRIASIFIILGTSMFGALFPVVARRVPWLRVHIPSTMFLIAKYFGSGVIVATAFIHLLDPALQELSSPCLSPAWQEYPYALAISLGSIFGIFVIEIFAFRWGTEVLRKAGVGAPQGHMHDIDGGRGQEIEKIQGDAESGLENSSLGIEETDSQESAIGRILGVMILEFGVLLHSVLIGLTLAVDPDFKILFVVIIFHQMFEGLGVGSRLAYMELPRKYAMVPIIGACLYGITTPIGIAAGLGVRTTYNPNSTTASIVSGVMDAFSSGILIYTGLVELMAHEFVFNKKMIEGPTKNLVLALGLMMLGVGLMALLGKWA